MVIAMGIILTMKINNKVIVSALVVFGFGKLAMASTLLSDDFSSYTDNSNLVGQGSWTQTGSAATTPIQVSSGKAVLGTSGQDIYKGFSSGYVFSTGSTLYIGATINLTSAQSGGDYFLHVSDPLGTTSNFYGRVFAKSTTGGYLLGFVDASGTGSTVTYGTNVFSFNTSVSVVVAWTSVTGANNDTFSLYVNPSSSTESSNAAYLTHTWTSTTVGEPTSVVAVNLRQGAAGSAPAGSVDNLVVATTFAEAAGFSPVPEPSTYASIFGSAALIGAAVYRRRRALVKAA